MKKLKEIKINQDHIIAWGLICILSYWLPNNLIKESLEGSFLYTPLHSLFFLIVYFFIFAMILFAFGKDFRMVVIPYAIVISLYIITVIAYPKNWVVLSTTLRQVFTFSLPALCGMLALEDFDYFFRKLALVSPFIIFCGLLYYQYIENGTYDMGYGYALLLPILMQVWMLINHKHMIFSANMILLGSILTLMKGSRLPLFIIAVFFIISFILDAVIINDRNKKYKINRFEFQIASSRVSVINLVLFLIIVIIIALFIANISQFFGMISDWLTSIGITSRNIYKFSLNGGATDGSGRDVFYRIDKQIIAGAPIFGYGLAGDCTQITIAFGKPFITDPETVNAVGNFAHSLIYQSMICFGIPIGLSLMFLLAFGIVLNFYTLKKPSYEFDFFMMIVVYEALQAFYSINFPYEPLIWLLIGMIIKRLPVLNLNRIIFVE